MLLMMMMMMSGNCDLKIPELEVDIRAGNPFHSLGKNHGTNTSTRRAYVMFDAQTAPQSQGVKGMLSAGLTGPGPGGLIWKLVISPAIGSSIRVFHLRGGSVGS